LLATQPDLYERLENFFQLPIKFVQVVRNPYDNITTMALRRESTEVEPSIDAYFMNCEKTVTVKKLVGEEAVLDIRQETLIEKPDETIRTLCSFLNLLPEEGFVRDCASILLPQPKRTRHKVQWRPDAIADVARRIEQYDFLDGYTFES